MNNLENNSTDPLPQPSNDEKLEKIQQSLNEIMPGQQRIFNKLNALESNQESLKKEVNERHVDLRGRIDLNNDKLDVVYRELRQYIKDTRNPAFVPVESR